MLDEHHGFYLEALSSVTYKGKQPTPAPAQDLALALAAYERRLEVCLALLHNGRMGKQFAPALASDLAFTLLALLA